MPELPEVETVRDGLERHVTGLRVAGVEVLRDDSVRRQDGGPLAFADQLVGRRLTAAVRRGKFLWLPLGEAGHGPDDAPASALMAHLGMSGQLLVRTGEQLAVRSPHLRVRLLLEPADARASAAPGGPPHGAVDDGAVDGGPGGGTPALHGPVALDFVDQRTFGHLSVTDLAPAPDGAPGGQGSTLAALPAPALHIARDLLDPALRRDETVEAIRRRRTGIKRALLDQRVVSGVGNIYADEALWRARLHYARATDTLRRTEAHRLLDAAEEVMRSALAQGGTSFDALYVNVNGQSGYFSRSLRSYARDGEPCYRCGTLIVREPFMNRSSYFCPRCQRRPRR